MQLTLIVYVLTYNLVQHTYIVVQKKHMGLFLGVTSITMVFPIQKLAKNK